MASSDKGRQAAVETLLRGRDLVGDLTPIIDLAVEIARCPIALITLLARDRQMFVAKRGIDLDSCPRSQSFCRHSVENGVALWVEDASSDPRFSTSALVTDHPHVRFYAGQPLTVEGHTVGSLCVLDAAPHLHDPDVERQLGLLARLTSERLAAHRDGRLLAGLVACSPDAIVTFDAHGAIQLWNPAAERLFGYSAKEMLGQSLGRILPERDRAFRLRKTWEIAQGFPTDFAGPIENIVGQRRDGVELPLEVSYSVERSGERFYLSAIMRDASERIAREAALSEALSMAEEGNRAKSAFIGAMSHELRTPLNAIIGLSERSQSEPGELRDRMAIIANAGADLKVILDDVLDLSRHDADGLTLTPVEVDLAGLLGETVALFAGEARQKGLALVLSADETCAVHVMIDPARLRQVLRNLLANALKFTEKGRIELNAHLAKGMFRFEVIDTGVGFSSELAEKVFERFYQVDLDRDRKLGGVGLGLAVSKLLVEKMGGAIVAQSIPGKGAVFSATIPVEIAPGATAGRPETQDPIATDLHVLAVDDNTVNLKVLTVIFESFGAQVMTASNGLEGLDLAKTHTFDIVLMDLHMPVMDGLTAVRHLRSYEAVQKRSPVTVIMISASDTPEDVQRSKQAGAQAHLGKPVDARKLLQLLSLIPSA